jgi:hypothetical protein
MSFHLTTLAAADLVTSRRRARSSVSHADLEAVAALLAYLLDEQRGGHPRVAACWARVGLS